MTPVIRIPSNIYSRLEQHAQGFDSPANVIERLLDHYEGSEQTGEAGESITPVAPFTSKRDTTKYVFAGQIYGKGRLVLAVVKAHISEHPGTNVHDLLIQFPKHLQGSSGVFSKESEAREILDRTGHRRHFLEPDELIELSDCIVAVSTEWGAGNIDNFVRQAKSLGHAIELQNG